MWCKMKLKEGNIWGKHSAYLTENIIMLFVLLVIVSVTLSSFIKVRRLEQESREQLMANITAQNLVEYGKAMPSNYEEILMNLGGEYIEGKYYFYYDSDWKRLKEKQSYMYIEEVVIRDEELLSGTLRTIQVNVYDREVDEKYMIYNLMAKVY